MLVVEFAERLYVALFFNFYIMFNVYIHNLSVMTDPTPLLPALVP